MTAINIFLQPDSISVFNDAALVDKGGVLRGIGNKIRTNPHWPGVAFCFGGAGAAGVLLTEFGTQFRSFDHLVARIESVLPQIVNHYWSILETMNSVPHLFVFAGWSECSAAAEIYEISPAEHSGFAQYKLYSRGQILIEPPVSAAAESQLRAKFNPDITPDVLEKLAIGIIETQRSSPHGGHTSPVIGGFVEKTTVLKDGAISQKIVKRWPEDTIGQLISPGPSPLV